MTDPTILVGVDFGASSERAFEAALELAGRIGATLDLVHVCPLPPPSFGDETVYTEPARDSLERLSVRAQNAGVTARTHLELETPVFGMLQAIDALRPYLVIVGSHGRSGFRRALLGSISESITRRSPVPVLIVPTPERREAAAKSFAIACGACGHILGDDEQVTACTRCGVEDAWIEAPIEPITGQPGPEPAVGEAPAADLRQSQTRDPASTFSISPPGGGNVDVNPELRVRY